MRNGWSKDPLNETNVVSHFSRWPLGLDIVRCNRRRKADTHEESGERLRKVFKIRRTESPSARQLFSMAGQVCDGKTVDSAEVDDQRGPFVFWCRWGRKQVQAFETALANAFPLTDFGKVWVYRFEFGESMNGTAGNQRRLAILQIATLRHDDEIKFLD